MLASSVAASSLYVLNLNSVSRPEFPYLSYFPVYTTLTIIYSAILACSSTLIMMRRVKSVCLKRTRFLSAVTPVTVAIAATMFPVNCVVASLQCEELARTGLDWARYVYVSGWAATLAFSRVAGAYITIAPRACIIAILICSGILLEAQFRRIVRSQVTRGRRAGERAVHHFEDTVGAAVTMAQTWLVEDRGATMEFDEAESSS
ncbi:hypothetical protein H9P43_008825 [Blastocladiella emersonii ATCC 22665]|nr:hypothetical protein H9P43_008825 [Blastocladiella emersonii ATCC 22665]